MSDMLPLIPCLPLPLAYIGPGAGFAFVGSFLVLAAALALALLSLVTFPVRFLIGLLRPARRGAAAADRVVVVGMDGLDPRRAAGLMGRGQMPNFARLAAEGTFTAMDTTCPPISPVAWSSFQTGVNPGKHNIFDFLNRDLRTYRPELSSCRTLPPARGRFRRRVPSVSLLRKSRAFWSVLGEHGVFSTVLRVPITYPPEPFDGLLLSAMCTPDLRGTQGSFTLFESAGPGDTAAPTGGLRIPVTLDGGRVRVRLPGPATGSGELSVALTLDVDASAESAVLRVDGQTVRLAKGVPSEWVPVRFGRGLRKARGICRFLLRSVAPRFQLYVTPVNIDPRNPVLPISHPAHYAIHLGKLHGPFATLGLAEDTWALNEGALDDAAFLEQAWAIQKEREAMFFEALARTRRGFCCCVFDLPDRVQHMFFRYADPTHPARRNIADPEKHRDAMDDVYRHMDALLGRVLAQADGRTVVFALSDHGFGSFRRGVNLNAWLAANGYLVARPGAEGDEYLAGVDWEKTRAYTFGLSGVYLNRKGREARGCVAAADCAALKAELAARLRELRDPAGAVPAVTSVFDSDTAYGGPYRGNGPDLVVGYAPGYRASWEAAVGRCDGPVFTDNTRCWSGDHCVDPAHVPGVLACNRALGTPRARPHITDLAPTVLGLFGIAAPGYMDGRAMAVAAPAAAGGAKGGTA